MPLFFKTSASSIVVMTWSTSLSPSRSLSAALSASACFFTHGITDTTRTRRGSMPMTLGAKYLLRTAPSMR